MLVALCLGPVTAAADNTPPADFKLENAFVVKVQPFLKQHCLSCHGAEKPKSDVRLDGPMPNLVDPKVAERWLAVKRIIAQGDMPPEGRPRPLADEIIPVLEWIDAANARAAAISRGGIGRRALRRLTRHEYVNTLHDALGLSFPHALLDLTSRLPNDAIAGGFSNDSNLQVTQTLLLRRSLDLAEDLLAVALPDEETIKPLRYEVDLRQVVGDAMSVFAKKSEAEQTKLRGPLIQNILVPSKLAKGVPAKLNIRGDKPQPFNISAEHLDPKRGLMLEPNPITIGVNKNALSLVLPFVPDRGVLRLRAKAAAVIEHDDSVPILRLSLGGPLAPGNAAYPIAEVPVTAAPDSPQDYVLEVPLLLVACDWNSFRRENKLYVQIDNGAALLGPTPVPDNYDQKKKDSYLKRNRLLLESFTLEIEASPTWPAKSEAVLLAPKDGEDESAWIRRSLGAFLAKAFRRPATKAEVELYLRAFRKEREAGTSVVGAYRMVAAAALVSPQMLYLIEPRTVKRRPLTSWELASRLSYLVRNSMPDAELFDRAADGTLSTEAELRKQLHRLLKEERAFALARDFTRQWLDLDVIAHLEPNVLRFGKIIDYDQDKQWYEKAIRRDLAAEPAYYFLDLIRNDGPVSELVSSEHMVVNDRMARFYGIPKIHGPEWRRVVAPRNRRGGLLTQAGCIAAATHAQERGEIKRGVYLARRIVGIDIPSPPGNVDVKPLDVQLTEDKSLRNLNVQQHLERHRSIQTCAVCHQRSDSLAFVWDEFDMFGLRKQDRQGKLLPFAVRGSLPDKTTFASFDEFRQKLIMGGVEDGVFAKAFSQRLYAYVLGRGLDQGDEVHLKTIRAAAAKEGGGLRALLTAMFLSEPFRHN
jgi:hypothetical protein